MTGKMTVTHRGWVGLALVASLACGKTAQTPPVATAAGQVADLAAAGTVEAVEGHVAALRSNATMARALALHDSVWADDTVVTADQSSVSIRLLHNRALWLLEGGQSRRVDTAAAWRAPQQVAEAALADHKAAPATASAGRHSEQEAAQTGEAATRPEAAPAPPLIAAEPTRHAAVADHKARAVAATQKSGALRSMGSKRVGGLGSIGMGGGTGGGEASASAAVVPDVTLSQQVRKGDPDPNDLARFVNRARVTIRVAYERALRADPTLRGTVVVLVTIRGGHVTNIALESEGDVALTDCVTVPLRRVAEATLDGVEVALTVKLSVKE